MTATPDPSPVRELPTSSISRADLGHCIGRLVGPNVAADHPSDGTATVTIGASTTRLLVRVRQGTDPGGPGETWFVTDSPTNQATHPVDPAVLGHLWADVGTLGMTLLAATDELHTGTGPLAPDQIPLAERITAVRAALGHPPAPDTEAPTGISAGITRR